MDGAAVRPGEGDAATEAPLVTIVLPTRDGSRYLFQALRSCLEQTFDYLEVVVIDDGSTDETPRLLDSVDDPRLVRLCNRESLGLPASLNLGFARARGDYLTWTSDDNWYEPQAIERMLAFLQDHDADFVCGDYVVIDETQPGPRLLRRLDDSPRFDEGNPVGACFLYSRRVIETVGQYDETCLLAEDYDYWIRVSRHFEIHHIAEPLYTYRLHCRSLTSRAERDRRAEAAASLVRIKHELGTVESEAQRLGHELGHRRYRSQPWPVRALGRLLRSSSGGRFDIARARYVPRAVTDCRSEMERFVSGHQTLQETVGRLGSLFLCCDPETRPDLRMPSSAS